VKKKSLLLRWILTSSLAVMAFVFVLFLFSENGSASLPMPESAEPVQKIDHPGLPNCYRVSATLIRGGQPTPDGFRELKRMGVVTVVNFRVRNFEEKTVRATGLKYIHLPMYTFFSSWEYFSRFLDLTAASDRLVFVHCQHGADRTGTAVALYRIFHQGWSREDALAEMTQGPFGFHKIHSHLKRFVRGFQRLEKRN